MEPIFANLFPSADKAVWLAQVQKELKNEAAYESLRWPTDEGFTVEPYYTSADLSHLPLDTIQKAQKAYPDWVNAAHVQVSDEKTANALLRDEINQGVEAFSLTLPTNGLNLTQLLHGIKLSDTPVFFRFAGGASPVSATDFIKSLQTVAPYQLKGGLLSDIDDATADITRLTANSPLFRTVCVNSHPFHNAGATATQELAFTLAALTDTFDRLTNSGLALEQILPKTVLSVSVGTSYFAEIAKLRALRVLFNRFVSHYPVGSTHYPAFIHAQTSTFYDAAVTPYTNLLRASTEAMAAVIGGCDVLTVHPFDTVLEKSATSTESNFSVRIARNVSILLKEESHLNKVTDPSAGSYYVESLTHQLIEAAWSLFVAVEKRGGLTKAVQDGFIQDELDRAFQAKIEAVRHGNKALVGVTKFRSDEATVENSPEFTPKGVTPNGALPTRRLAEEFE
ncbi:methylmalonyl-CoA mutase family protein [Spirosoma sp. KNUC1025]|uniref:methylmalonyl-CoA mutase family protein n=1 Tax=Spirosoma sp. KNUC1025 TaxID=2894082 RepID=UPI00386C8BB8|nr:methylmalonyl-CoA mutase family protein [Spirosoma sp. KNUC1025]